MDEKTRKYYDNCIDVVRANRKASERDFESKITYIAAGAIALSIAMYPSLGKCNKWIMIVAWILLIATILANLFSLIYNKEKCNKLDREIREQILKNNADSKDYTDTIEKINRNIKIINYLTVASMLIGLICLIIYLIINA
jgi:hypothetical protein